MSDEYTPTTEEVIRGFVAPRYAVDPRRDGEGFAEYLGRASMDWLAAQMQSEAAIRRWLAARDREVAAKALREAARGYWGVEGDPDMPSTSSAVRRVLNRRADRIESQANEKGAGDVR